MRRSSCLVGLFLLVLTACKPPVDPPSPGEGTLHQDETFDHDGEARTFHLYEPAATDGDRPLVLLLHGGGATIDNHIGLGSVDWPHQIWIDIADEDGLFLVVPQGLNSHWNDCRADCEHCGGQDDDGFLMALIDDLAARFDIDLDRVHAVGESNGGFMTLRLAQQHPDRFAAMGVVVALMPAADDCPSPGDEPISIQFQVGTADETIPYDGGLSGNPPSGTVQSAAATMAHWVGHNQCDPTPTSAALDDLDPGDGSTAFRADYACPATSTALSMITMEGAGHVPPSIEVQVSNFWESIVGEQSHDLEGAREFWAFFQGL